VVGGSTNSTFCNTPCSGLLIGRTDEGKGVLVKHHIKQLSLVAIKEVNKWKTKN